LGDVSEDRPHDDRPFEDLAAKAPPDEDPLATEPPVPPARVEPMVVPRWVQLVMLPLAVLGLWALARAAGVVLLIFVTAAVVALILNPIVKFLERRARLPRGLAIATVYVGFFVALGGGIALLVNPISDQVRTLQRQVPDLIDSANAGLADFQEWLDGRGVGLEVKRQGETALETLRDKALTGSGDIVAFSQDVLRVTIEAGFGLILILVISIYMLLYGDTIGRVVRSVMPPGDGTPEDDFPIRAQKGVFGYVRGQLLFSLIMGVSAGIALWIMGVLGVFPEGKTYAVFFGAFFGLMELIPYLGPFLGALPPVLVALFQDPLTAVWVALMFLALQQLEGHVVAPQVFGRTLRINPILVIFALLMGGQLYGIVGALVALPIAALIKETVVYLRRHLVLEPWGTLRPQAIAAGRLPSTRLEPARCPECGAAHGEEDAFCRACGAPLETRAGAPGEPRGPAHRERLAAAPVQGVSEAEEEHRD
jgi:predicted PurR-regulated permease PerM